MSIFAQLEPAAQGVPLLSTPGNHDYWFEGVPEFALDDCFLGYDQFGFGGAQFYAMDTAASWAPQAPLEELISPKGRPASQFSQAPAFLDLSGKPKDDAKAVNFQHYSIAGNVGFIVITCVGGDPRPFVKEACAFMKQKNPDLVLVLGHWNKPPPAGMCRMSQPGHWITQTARLFGVSQVRHRMARKEKQRHA